MNLTIINLYHIRHALRQEIIKKKSAAELDHVIRSYELTLNKIENYLKKEGHCKVAL